MAQFAVIGIGRFGRAVARNLTRLGQSVLAIDRDQERLRLVAADVDSVVAADTTNEGAVLELGLDRMTAVVVTIGSRATEASLLTTAILSEVGVPLLVARAFDERHARLLLAAGAHEVVNPEDEMGQRLAGRLAHPTIVDQLVLGEATVAEVEAPEEFVGRSLADLGLRGRFGVSVLAIRRGGSTLANPEAEASLESGDIMVLLGRQEAIEALAGRK